MSLSDEQIWAVYANVGIDPWKPGFELAFARAVLAAAAQGQEPWFMHDDDWDGSDPRVDLSTAAWLAANDAFHNLTTQRGFSEWCDRIRAAVRVLIASPLASPPPQGPAALADALDEAMQPDARDALLRQALEALEDHTDSLDAWADGQQNDIVPINRTRGTTAGLRTMVAAIRKHLGERG